MASGTLLFPWCLVILEAQVEDELPLTKKFMSQVPLTYRGSDFGLYTRD